uniref:Uncharacterized protein n=1 Tax=Palpitomonas bilix TaxID=652834 RepID=A0A7S3G3N0_9EUKA
MAEQLKDLTKKNDEMKMELEDVKLEKAEADERVHLQAGQLDEMEKRIEEAEERHKEENEEMEKKLEEKKGEIAEVEEKLCVKTEKNEQMAKQMDRAFVTDLVLYAYVCVSVLARIFYLF